MMIKSIQGFMTKIPNKSSSCMSLSAIIIDSVCKINKTYPKVFSEESKC